MLRDSWVPGEGGAARQDVVAPSGVVVPVIRIVLSIGLIVVSCLVVALATGLLSFPLNPTIPQPTPVSSGSVTDQVLAYALGWRNSAEDPAIVLPNGLRVKASNYRGVRINGTLYYYNLWPRPSYDPLARGEVPSQQINVVAIRGDYPDRVMIYTIPNASRPNS